MQAITTPHQHVTKTSAWRIAAFVASLAFATSLTGLAQPAQQAPPSTVLFQNVRIFDGKGGALSAPSHVLVRRNKIERISTAPISVDRSANTQIVDGSGRTLMPGLSDMHAHTMFETVPQPVLLVSDIAYLNLVAAKAAENQLMRGFTSVRDVGGPAFSLKRAIDQGLFAGPRIYPSGSMISQTSGHGDYRLITQLPREPGAPLNYDERVGMIAIADGADQVLLRTRENLMRGASQIKLMAGGGVASSNDPLDVQQFREREIHAAVEAAQTWGTYAGDLRGLYTYFADAGRFTECLTRQNWPVAQEQDNAALESAYVKVRQQPSEDMLVTLQGRVVMRPKMEGEGPQPTLVVERFTGIWHGETCGVRFATAPLENTYWKLTRLGDVPVTVASQQREPHVILTPESGRVGGSGGCNRLVGSYELHDDKLTFGQMAGTMMACPEGSDTEQAFLEALRQVYTWKIMGQHLELFDAAGTLVARFEARHMQ